MINVNPKRTMETAKIAGTDTNFFQFFKSKYDLKEIKSDKLTSDSRLAIGTRLNIFSLNFKNDDDIFDI
jgi:hypothetical protein